MGYPKTINLLRLSLQCMTEQRDVEMPTTSGDVAARCGGSRCSVQVL